MKRSAFDRDVAIILLTGYDLDIIPPDLERVLCLQKPVRFTDWLKR